jgi:hypothetical protein
MHALRDRLADHTIFDWAAEILEDSLEIMDRR